MTVPGAPIRQNEVDFYSREYPIESQNIDYSADRQWATTVLTPEAYAHRKEHEQLNAPLVEAARHTGDIELSISVHRISAALTNPSDCNLGAWRSHVTRAAVWGVYALLGVWIADY
jgi:hypothetical protein